MNVMNRPVASPGANCIAIRTLFERLRLFRGPRRGSAVIEIALCLPILLLVMTGIFTFGVAINNYLILTNATAIGAQAVAVSRGTSTGNDPCNTAYTAITAAAPLLSSSGVSLTLVLNGTSYSGTTCGSTTTAPANLIQGVTAQVTAQYPCSLGVYGNNYVPGCKLTAQIAEIIQ